MKKVPAIRLLNLSTWKGRLRKYKLTSLWDTGKGVQEAARYKVEYTTWHGCTQYIVTWSEWGLPQLQIHVSDQSQDCYFAARLTLMHIISSCVETLCLWKILTHTLMMDYWLSGWVRGARGGGESHHDCWRVGYRTALSHSFTHNCIKSPRNEKNSCNKRVLVTWNIATFLSWWIQALDVQKVFPVTLFPPRITYSHFKSVTFTGIYQHESELRNAHARFHCDAAFALAQQEGGRVALPFDWSLWKQTNSSWSMISEGTLISSAVLWERSPIGLLYAFIPLDPAKSHTLAL